VIRAAADNSARGEKLPLLELRGVSKSFRRPGGSVIHAVKCVDLTVAHGETVALVGESGSGKSTLGRIALCLTPPDAGSVLLSGQSFLALSGEELRTARTAIQPVFQDPGSSFNPRRTIREHLGQATRRLPVEERERIGVELLDKVGLRPGRSYMSRYPHELSGGQRQRVAVARALAIEPQLIVADEPLSGADVSIRGQILNLLSDLRNERHVAYLMITHDITIARAFAHRVAVMKEGEIVESGPAEQVLRNPQHPYTKRLLDAIPWIDARH
jgi:ABC-type glutathione transport system ATPase component